MRNVAFAVVLQVGLVPAVMAVVRFDEPAVEPASPTSSQAVSARLLEPVACSRRSFGVTRSGSAVTIAYPDPELDCSGPITAVPVKVEVGRLAAGTYLFRIINITSVSQPFLEDEAIVTVSPAPTPCDLASPSPPSLCLQDGRFAVTVEWTARDGRRGGGSPVAVSDETGVFSFSQPGNVEITVKILDACNRNGRYWVLAGGMTNPSHGVTVRVRQLVTGIEARYQSPVGSLFPPLRDTSSFSCVTP